MCYDSNNFEMLEHNIIKWQGNLRKHMITFTSDIIDKESIEMWIY